MQNLLNITLYVVIFIYALAMLNNANLAVTKSAVTEVELSESSNQFQQVELLQSEAVELSEPTILATTIAANDHHVDNPAHKAFDKATKAQMKAYITKQNLKEKLEAQMSKKLYKANKLDIYQALQAI